VDPKTLEGVGEQLIALVKQTLGPMRSSLTRFRLNSS